VDEEAAGIPDVPGVRGEKRLPELRFPWLATLIAIAAILVSAHFSFARQREQLRRGALDELESVAGMKAEEVANWREERLSDARRMAAHPLLARALHRLDADHADHEARRDLRAWCESRMLHADYEAIALFSARGERLVEAGARPLETSAPQVEAALRERQVSLSPFHVDGSAGSVHADLLAPVFLDDGLGKHLMGLAGLRVAPEWNVAHILSWPGANRGASIALAQASGTDVVLLTAGRDESGAAAWHRNEKGSSALALKVARRESSALETTIGSRHLLAAVRPIPGSEWSIVVETDYGRVLTTFREQLWWGIGLAFALVGLVLSSATLWWQRQVATVRRREHEAELERLVLARHLELLSRHANDILLLTDPEGRVVEANERAADAYGCARHEIVGREALGLLDVDARAPAEARLRLVESGEAQVFESEHRRLDGTSFPVEVSARLIEVEGRRYVQSVIRDITERRRAEEVLRQSEARFRAAFFQSAVGAVLLDGSGRFLDFNAALTGMLGYSADELRQKTFRDLMHPDDLSAGCAAFSQVVDGARGTNAAERRCVRKDGQIMHARHSFSAIRDARGEFQYAVAIVEDVTERVRAEADLRASEERLRLALETTADGIWDWDLTLNRVHVSPRLAEMTGWESDEIPDKRAALGILHADERERLLDQLAAARRGHEHHIDTEHKFRAKSGEWRWVRHRIKVVARDPEGSARRMLGAVSDITENKALQSRLLLADRMAALGTLAAGVAHEVNTPLAYVISNLDFVRDSLSHLEAGTHPIPRLIETRRALADASEGAERVRVIVRDLKTFSRTGEDRHPLDVLDVLRSALHLASSEIRLRARLVQDLAPVPAVTANASRLGQVFLNLLLNAAQALPDDRAAEHEVRVTTSVDVGGWANVDVRDTGCGIPAELLGRIFDPFFTTKPAGIGTGLGLGICQEIVSGLGGAIEVESTVGRGSLFRVRLPSALPFSAIAAETSADLPSLMLDGPPPPTDGR